jgi:hypothetical protein
MGYHQIQIQGQKTKENQNKTKTSRGSPLIVFKHGQNPEQPGRESDSVRSIVAVPGLRLRSRILPSPISQGVSDGAAALSLLRMSSPSRVVE